LLIERTTCIEAPVRLQVRVGIATGLAIVGDLLGAGEAQERGIVGETPNLAARLQGLAEPGAVAIDLRTRLLLGELFDYHDLGTVELKGFDSPVHAFQVVRQSAMESRFEALHPFLAPLIGREEEIDLLERRWQRTREGNGQVVLISGEPGIGKSRLTSALLEHVAGEPHIRLRYFCSPHHTNSALYPIIRQLERAAGFDREDDAETKVGKLERQLAVGSASPEDQRLLADLLSLPDIGRYPALQLSPQQRKQMTVQALFRQLKALAHRLPVLQIFEDMHWADPTSLETMDREIDFIRSLPIMLVMTFRPEFTAPWLG
jgi:AAA ATPase domain/Adenylate and Guanylate cyclase catalytic domain